MIATASLPETRDALPADERRELCELRQFLDNVIRLSQCKTLDDGTFRVYVGLQALAVNDTQAPAYRNFPDLTDKRLAAMFGIGTGTASKIIQRLEKASLAHRRVEKTFYIDAQTGKKKCKSQSTLFLPDTPSPEAFPAVIPPAPAQVRAAEYQRERRARMACKHCGTIGEWEQVWVCKACGHVDETQEASSAQSLSGQADPDHQSQATAQTLRDTLTTTQSLSDEETTERKYSQDAPVVAASVEIAASVDQALAWQVKTGLIDPEPCEPPEPIRSLAIWCPWKSVPRKDGGMGKRPINVHTGHWGSPTDPATWGTLQQAREAQERFSCAGIGFMLGTADAPIGITVVDPDDCRQADGTFLSVVSDLVLACDSYTEASVSGQGIHLILRGLKPGGDVKAVGFQGEVYDRAHFIVWTGKHLSGTPMTINERQAQIEALYSQHVAQPQRPRPIAQPRPAQPISLSDQEVIERGRKARNGANFSKLFDRGDLSHLQGDASRGDLILCLYLARLTDSDPLRMDQLFRLSALMRDKWDEVHRRDGQTYGQMTIRKALSQ